MIKEINCTSLAIDNTYRWLDTNSKLLLTRDPCQDVKGTLVSSGVRTLDISLKTGQGPLKSVTPWAADTGGLSLSCGLFLHEHQQASEGKLVAGWGGVPGKGLPVWPPRGCKWWALLELSMNPSPPSPPWKAFVYMEKEYICPHIFPPEVTIEICSTWGMRTGKFYCWRRSRKAS